MDSEQPLKRHEFKFLQNSFFYITATTVGGFLGYLFHFFMSRGLTVGEYGELQSLSSVFMICSVFVSAISIFATKYSSTIAVNKDYASGKNFLSWLNNRVYKIAFALTAVFLLLVPIVRQYLHISDSWGLIAIGLSLFAAVAPMGYLGSLMGWGEFVAVGLVTTLGALVKLITSIVFVKTSPTASSAAWAYLVSGLFALALAFYYGRKKITDLAGGDEGGLAWKEKYFHGINVAKSVLPILIFSSMIVLLQNVDVVMAKNLTTPALTGYYGSLKILGTIILTINLAIVALMLPDACAIGHSGECVSKKTLGLSYGLILLFSIPAVMFYYFFPLFTIKLLFGAKYLLAADDLWLFGLIAMVFALFNLEANFAYGRHDYKVSYILTGALVLMMIGIYGFHDNIREIAMASIVAFTVGYFAVLARNLLHRYKHI